MTKFMIALESYLAPLGPQVLKDLVAGRPTLQRGGSLAQLRQPRQPCSTVGRRRFLCNRRELGDGAPGVGDHNFLALLNSVQQLLQITLNLF